MGADASEHARQRQAFHDKPDGLFVFTLPYELDVTLNIDARRTGGHTGSPVQFLDSERNRNPLRKGSEYGLSFGKAFVKLVRPFHRADQGAFPTARAHAFLDIAGLPMNLHFEAAGFSLDSANPAQSQQLDIDVPADLDQFRGDNSSGAVIGGERLVQLRHNTTDGR
jgi:hypothetical protein